MVEVMKSTSVEAYVEATIICLKNLRDMDEREYAKELGRVYVRQSVVARGRDGYAALGGAAVYALSSSVREVAESQQLRSHLEEGVNGELTAFRECKEVSDHILNQILEDAYSLMAPEQT